VRQAVIQVLDELCLTGIELTRMPSAPFRWYGGKGCVTRWILSHFPPPSAAFKVYVEPFAGAASVFWSLPRRYEVEVLNDIDERIVNVFRVLQCKQKFSELLHRLLWTPYSLAEFRRAGAILDGEAADDVTRAWAFLVVLNQGFAGHTAHTPGCWGRTFTTRATRSYWARVAFLREFHARLANVQLDCRDALDVIAYWDRPETLFYVDPPYVISTRRYGRYDNEMTDEQHEQLVDTLLKLQGGAIVSGYAHPIYGQLEKYGWHRVDYERSCDAIGRIRKSRSQGQTRRLANALRIHSLWISPTVARFNSGPSPVPC